MKRTTSQVNSALNVLANAKMSEMTVEEKGALIRLLLKMRSVAKKWEELVAESRQRLAPDNLDALEAAVKEGEQAEGYAEAKAALDRFYTEVTEVVKDGFVAEHEVGDPLASDAVMRLAASNPDWDVATAIAIHELLTE